MIKWIKNLKSKQNSFSEKKETRLEQMKKNPYKRVDSEKMTDIENKYLRVGGLVKANSLKFIGGKWIFEVVDQNKNSIDVEFSKTLPSLVEENKGIIVEGKFINDIFIAEIVLAKHDENYMPQSAIDKLKEEGKWKGN